MLCDLLGGEISDSNETSEAGFFDFDNLPELSEERNTAELFTLVMCQLENIVTYTD
jgi:hypothetical protein